MASSHMEKWTKRFTAWAETRDDIRAVVVIGSRGRQVYYDEDEGFSDLDVLVLTTRSQLYATSTAWMQEIAPTWAALVDDREEFRNMWPVPCGFSVCDGPMIVDCVFLSTLRIRLITQVIRLLNQFPRLCRWFPDFVITPMKGVTMGFRYGVKILIDKHGLIERLRQMSLTTQIEEPVPPTLQGFQRCVDNFWYGVVIVANYLQKGHYFYVKRELDKPQKAILLKMIKWHARSARNWQDDNTWYRDKWIGQWADPRVVAALPEMFGAYNTGALWQSLLAQMDCFRWLVAETVASIGYAYLAEADRKVTPWVTRCFQETTPGN